MKWPIFAVIALVGLLGCEPPGGPDVGMAAADANAALCPTIAAQQNSVCSLVVGGAPSCANLVGTVCELAPDFCARDAGACCVCAPLVCREYLCGAVTDPTTGATIACADGVPSLSDASSCASAQTCSAGPCPIGPGGVPFRTCCVP